MLRQCALKLLLATLALTGLLIGCNPSGPDNSKNTVVFQPPNESFARSLGITQGPISADQAKAIAAAAAGGTALSVEQENEDGVAVFGVIVQTSNGLKDVKVRISDGAVTKIESDDSGGEQGGSED
jgi:uncharacterized membrane protein YkoI